MRKITKSVLAVLILASTEGSAQERTMNDGAQATLRTWPQSGQWVVMLGRNDQHQLYCSLVTGHRDLQRDEFYVWGMRHLIKSWSAVIADHNSAAVAGDNVATIIDGTHIGTYPISKRINKQNLEGIRADLPDSDSKKILRLMALGDSLKFSTDGSTYSVKLDGIAHALAYMSACDAEAQTLSETNP